jgi:hypothetical protein
MRTSLGVVVLVAFLAAIANAQLRSESRVFCFAMFSSANPYDIRARVNGDWLTPEQIEQRYHRRARGVEMRSIQHVKNAILAREARSTLSVFVGVTYRTNGGRVQNWTFER